ncbi:MAG: cytochrome P460 family protein [Vicinamibacterales bacterium]
MTRRSGLLCLFVALVWAGTVSHAVLAQAPAEDGPRYVNGTSLVRPADYRAWPFLGSGLGLTYDAETAAPSTPPAFSNVFVNPSAYRAFLQTGTWPDGTVLLLEFRRALTGTPPNTSGRFQGDLTLLEAEVKDARFPGGWAYFTFGRPGAMLDAAPPMGGEEVERCIECHTEHTAVERTFVQFYPTLLEVARARGTVKPGF